MALVIAGAHVLDPSRPTVRADIRVESGRITEVGPNLSKRGAEVLDADGMLATPGLINGHTHSGQSLDRGTTPNLPLDLWIAWAIFGGVPRTADDAYTAAAAGALEMLSSGCTAVLDHVHLDPDDFENHGDAVVAAYEDIGIRAAVAPMIGDLPFSATVPAHLVSDATLPLGPALDPRALATLMESFIQTHKHRHDRITPMLGPGAPQRCSDEYLAMIIDLARRHDVGIHTHVLETKSQVFAGRDRYRRSTIAHVHEMGLLGPGTSLAHVVWADPDEIALIAASGSTVVHNPWSNLRCGSGVMPMRDLVDAGVDIALGSDGAASNDNQNMFEVLKLATVLQTLVGDHQRWPSAEEVWTRSLAGGAAAVGAPIGALAPGMLADIVLLTLDRHVLADRGSAVASLAFAEHGESVHTVLVHGEVVISDGRSTRIDEVALGDRARGLQRRLHDHRDERVEVFRKWAPELERVEAAVADLPLAVERRIAS